MKPSYCLSVLSVAFAWISAVPMAMGGPLATDPAALPDFRGTALFDASGILLVELDYAVYEPGAYPDDGVNGDDPSDGTAYVYAYQIFNVSASRSLTTLGIGLEPCHAVIEAVMDPLHATTGGLEPDLSVLLFDSLTLDFLDPQLPAGGHSIVVLMTSPNPPGFFSAAIQDGGLTDQELVASPQPDPTVPADFDHDCDVDLSDFGHFQSCATGPAIPQNNPACQDADLDGDDDVDQEDFGRFQRCFTGAGNPVDPGCQ